MKEKKALIIIKKKKEDYFMFNKKKRRLFHVWGRLFQGVSVPQIIWLQDSLFNFVVFGSRLGVSILKIISKYFRWVARFFLQLYGLRVET